MTTGREWTQEKKDTEIAEIIKDLVVGSDREKRTTREFRKMTQPGVVQTVDHTHPATPPVEDPTWDLGVPAGENQVRAGLCPCSLCGHEFMWECHDDDCKDCTSTCN